MLQTDSLDGEALFLSNLNCLAPLDLRTGWASCLSMLVVAQAGIFIWDNELVILDLVLIEGSGTNES